MSSIVAHSTFLEFGWQTYSALVKDGICVLESRNTSDMPMGIVKVCVAGMAQALVPENALSLYTQFLEAMFLENSVDSSDKERGILGRTKGCRSHGK